MAFSVKFSERFQNLVFSRLNLEISRLKSKVENKSCFSTLKFNLQFQPSFSRFNFQPWISTLKFQDSILKFKVDILKFQDSILKFKVEILNLQYVQVTCLFEGGGDMPINRGRRRACLKGGWGGAEPPHEIFNLESSMCSGDVPI